MLVDESIKARAARSPIEPQHKRVLGRIPFRKDKVVEKILPLTLINSHVPLNKQHKSNVTLQTAQSQSKIKMKQNLEKDTFKQTT